MRTHRLVYIVLLLAACKASTPASVSKYSEDLSVHRQELSLPGEQPTHTTTSAQKEEYQPLDGHITSELDQIIQIAIDQNQDGKLVDGYVIQVYSGNSREEANKAKLDVLRSFSDLSPFVTYHQPNFRVKAGRFVNRLEAHRIYEQVKEKFPRAILIPERFTLTYE